MSDIQRNYLITEDSITMNKFQQVYDELMRRTWTVNHAEYNLADEGWTWGYHNHKRAVGTCYFDRWNKSGCKVMISKALLEVNIDSNAKDFEDTIRHEIAHAIDYSIRRASDHGYLWQNIAVQVGANPSPNKSTIKSVAHKWVGTCNSCGKEQKRHKLTMSARSGACGSCCKTKNNGRFSSEFMFDWVQQF